MSNFILDIHKLENKYFGKLMIMKPSEYSSPNRPIKKTSYITFGIHNITKHFTNFPQLTTKSWKQ